MSLYLKDPQSRVDYGFAWDGYADGQVVTASLWTVTPQEEGGVMVEADGFDAGATSVRLSGGREGHVYAVTNRVTLSDGQVEERSLTIRAEAR